MDTTYARRIHQAAALGMVIDLVLPFFWSIILPAAIWGFGPSSRFNSHHGWQAVKFQLLLTLYAIILLALCLIGLAVTRGGGATLSVTTHSPIGAIGGLVAAGGFALILLCGVLAIFLLGLIMPLVAAGRAGNGDYYVSPLSFSAPRNGSVA